MQEEIWVKVPPGNDPALAGRRKLRKLPLQPARYYTEKPEAVDPRAPGVQRHLRSGALVQVPAPAASAAPAKRSKE